MKYIMQYVNVYSNEVMREVVHNNTAHIFNCIQGFENAEKNRETFKNKLNKKDIMVLIDSNRKMWDAEYLSYRVNEDEKNDGMIYYRLHFKVRIREVQINFDKIK